MEPSIFIYCHLFSDSSKGIITSIKLPLSSLSIRIFDVKSQLSKYLLSNNVSNIKYIPKGVSKTLYAPLLNDTIKLNTFFEEKDDIYVLVETEVIPVKANASTGQQDIVLSYKTLTNYSFYVASETVVRVMVPVPGISKVPKENIISSFTEDSLEVKINKAEKGNNYRFAVPRLDAKIIPEQSEAIVKGEELILRLKKAKKDDHWSYLFKQKYVGE